jgi:3-methylfumaryl-CoA hydratase
MWRVDMTPQLLFRFSAFTFNGHRIHYDYPYAVNEEGYDGLVVHGPLQAALVLNQISTVLGHVPRRFDYRCVAPLIAGQTTDVETRREGQAIVARIRNAAGITTIEATASP